MRSRWGTVTYVFAQKRGTVVYNGLVGACSADTSDWPSSSSWGEQISNWIFMDIYEARKTDKQVTCLSAGYEWIEPSVILCQWNSSKQNSIWH